MSQLNKFNSIIVLFTLFINIRLINFAYSEGKVVARVNGVAINEEILLAEVNKKLPLTSYHSNISNEKLQEVRTQVLQELIEEELLYQEAKRQKLVVDTFELEQQIALMKSGYASEKEFQQELSKTGLNSLSLMAHFERRLLIEKILQQEINKKVKVTEADLRTYYEANKSKFVVPEQFRLRHILISVAPGAMASGWTEGLKKAEQIYSRIMEGEDFAKLATEVSADSSSREKGGDIGWFHKGQLISEIEEAFGEMKNNVVSKPVHSIYGYHILKLEDQRPEKQLTFEQINKEDWKKKLIKNQITARRQEFLIKLKAQSTIRIFEL